MNLCAFLAPEGIPRGILRQWDRVTGANELNKAIAALTRYSLVEATPESLSVHRLVQEITRQRLSDADRRTFAEAAVRIINNAFPENSNDVRTWPDCARLLPHAQAVSDHAEQLEVAREATSRLLNEFGIYLYGHARFVEAKQAFERALAIGEAAYGSDHPQVAIRVNNLGNVLQDLGNLQAAKQAFERALRIQEAVYGSNHPMVAIDVNNLGDVLQALGDLQAAKQAFERAITIDEAAYGPNHPNVAIDVNNLGDVLQALGDLHAAKQACERALKIFRYYLGDEHPNTQRVLRNLQSVEDEIRRRR